MFIAWLNLFVEYNKHKYLVLCFSQKTFHQMNVNLVAKLQEKFRVWIDLKSMYHNELLNNKFSNSFPSVNSVNRNSTGKRKTFENIEI